MKEYKTVSVDFLLDSEMVARLEESLPFWQSYQSQDGSYPFSGWSVEDLFRIMMEEGSTPYIKSKIHYYRWRAGLETEPFPVEEVAAHA